MFHCNAAGDLMKTRKKMPYGTTFFLVVIYLVLYGFYRQIAEGDFSMLIYWNLSREKEYPDWG